MSWLSGDVSELNASVLSTQAICMTHIAVCGHCTLASGYLLLSRALHHTTPVSLTLHVLCTQPSTMNECQLTWHSSHAEIRSYCIFQHLTMFHYACILSKLLVNRQATPKCPPVTMTNMVHNEIYSWLVLYHRRHAVTLFSETSLYFAAQKHTNKYPEGLTCSATANSVCIYRVLILCGIYHDTSSHSHVGSQLSRPR
jgi:hypothetical protein